MTAHSSELDRFCEGQAATPTTVQSTFRERSDGVRHSFFRSYMAKHVRSGVSPLVADRPFRDLQGFRYFLIAQTAEKFQHDHARRFRILRLEILQCLIHQ